MFSTLDGKTRLAERRRRAEALRVLSGDQVTPRSGDLTFLVRHAEELKEEMPGVILVVSTNGATVTARVLSEHSVLTVKFFRRRCVAGKGALGSAVRWVSRCKRWELAPRELALIATRQGWIRECLSRAGLPEVVLKGSDEGGVG